MAAKKNPGASPPNKPAKELSLFLRILLLTTGIAALATGGAMEGIQGAGKIAFLLWVFSFLLILFYGIGKYGVQNFFQRTGEVASKVKEWADGLEPRVASDNGQEDAEIAAPIEPGLPPLDVLPAPPMAIQRAEQERTGKGYANRVNAAFRRCGMLKGEEQLEVLNIQTGPGSVRITIQMLEGMHITRLITMSNNLSNSFGVNSVQIEQGGRAGSAAIIIPFNNRLPVYLKTIMQSSEFKNFKQKAELPIVLGVNDTWSSIWVDLVSIKHILIAGATGSGKSVCLTTIITTLLMCLPPDNLQFVFIDPKMVELTSFKDFPHTMTVATTPKDALKSLSILTVEMDRRYEVFQKHSVKNIQHYWKKTNDRSLPYIVVVIDELADLMLMAKQKDYEEDLPSAEHSITRLTQKARAAGIHLVVATQRPSVDVITGVIKANLPSRISFYLLSQHDYRTILDEVPSFELMGKGDGLAIIEGQRGRIRFQGACIAKDDIQTEATIEKLKDFWNQPKAGNPNANLVIEELTSIQQNKIGISEDTKDIDKEITIAPTVEFGSMIKPITPPKQMALLPNLLTVDSPESEPELDIDLLKFLIAQTWSEADRGLEKIKAPSIPTARKILKIKQDRIIQLYNQLVEEKWLEAPPKPGIPYYIIASPEELQGVLHGETIEV